MCNIHSGSTLIEIFCIHLVLLSDDSEMYIHHLKSELSVDVMCLYTSTFCTVLQF